MSAPAARPRWMIRYDMRTAPRIGAPRARLYAAALEQCAWADAHGCAAVMLAEHHAAPDGYLPSPAIMAAAVAARTDRMRLLVCQTPLRDPFAVAEDITVLDHISAGRVELVYTIGYVPAEYQMYGEQFDHRIPGCLEKFAALRSLLQGEQACYRGRHGKITPGPVQQPRPPIRFGGATPAAARRAAHYGDAFMPIIADPGLVTAYEEECASLGRNPVTYQLPAGGLAVLVTDDPERDWATIGPYFQYDANANTAFRQSHDHWHNAASRPVHQVNPFSQADDIGQVRALGLYSLVTPDLCAQLIRQTPAPAAILLHPLVGGLDPDIAWRSLHLFAEQVLPKLDAGAASHRTLDAGLPLALADSQNAT